ncbi:MAG TPA: hypothetical protein VM432_14705, partial [Bdellovibrionales bacterium]|nr:hypothetical protein [Bdellovibrionales bacterium]
PGFRSYLIAKLLEQAQIGVLEIHLGESTGEIHFDDWTLGIKGEFGFVQWLRTKHSNQSLQWWKEQFGELGRDIYEKRPIVRSAFLKLNSLQSKNFEREFGKRGSWNGENSDGQVAFLFDLYQHNLQRFLKELRAELGRNGFSDVVIDVWGFANWMPAMTVQPNAYISTPPDERWKLNWPTDPNFDLNRNRERIKKIMQEQMVSVKPVPVVYMIDHSQPFDEFKMLSDERQAELTAFFSDITKELGANFVFRSYSNDRNLLGPKTKKVIETQCRQKKLNFCPTNS